MTSASGGERSPGEPAGATRVRRWGFLGGGKMATALIRGMLRAGVAEVGGVVASDPLASARSALATETGIAVFEANPPVVERSDVLVLAVKPQAMTQLLGELRPLVGPGHLIISIAAGVSIATLSEGLGGDRRLVRVMPNTPALLGEGASAYALGPRVEADDGAVVRAFLDSVGRTVQVPESMLDAVTGLSGSGPAFVYLMIEALSDGGVRMGLRATLPPSWPLRPYSALRGWSWRPACIRGCSRTRSRARAERRSPDCMPWSGGASGAP